MSPDGAWQGKYAAVQRVCWGAVALAIVIALAALALSCDGGGTERGATTEATGQAATQSASRAPLIVTANTVTGREGQPSENVCVLASKFKRGQDIVWRIKVYDPRTGKSMDDNALKDVVVTLADGQKLPAKYGAHPALTPTDFFWAASWKVPLTYPTGSLKYVVRATSKDDRSGEFAEFNVAPSLLTVVAQ